MTYVKECFMCLGDTKVIDSRTRLDGTIKRKRKCLNCGFEFTTVETLEGQKMNHEHYSDPTADTVIKKMTAEEKKVHDLVKSIKTMCELAGFKINNRIELTDNRGRVYK